MTALFRLIQVVLDMKGDLRALTHEDLCISESAISQGLQVSELVLKQYCILLFGAFSDGYDMGSAETEESAVVCACWPVCEHASLCVCMLTCVCACACTRSCASKQC